MDVTKCAKRIIQLFYFQGRIACTSNHAIFMLIDRNLHLLFVSHTFSEVSLNPDPNYSHKKM